MAETKAWHQSNGVRGALGTIIVAVVILGSVAVESIKTRTAPPITYDTAVEIQEIVQENESQAEELVVALITLIGGCTALYGRIKAASTVVFKKPKPE